MTDRAVCCGKCRWFVDRLDMYDENGRWIRLDRASYCYKVPGSPEMNSWDYCGEFEQRAAKVTDHRDEWERGPGI